MARAALLVAVLALSGCEVNLNSEGVVSRETKRFDVTGTPDLQLETFDGAIEVHSWDRDEVEVEIEKRAMEQRLVDEMQVTADQQGNRILVKVSSPSSEDDFDGVQIGVHFSPSARLRVALPRNSNLTLRTADGSITVEDVSGKISLNTNDGSIRASRLSGEIVARTSDGSIRIDRAEGAIDIETEDGSITLDATPTTLRARTNDGSIRLEVGPDSTMTADWDVQTDDGSVVLTLPASFDAVLDAETRDGSVRATNTSVPAPQSDGEGRETRAEREERRRMLKATLGSGGHVLKVRTGDGSIRIE